MPSGLNNDFGFGSGPSPFTAQVGTPFGSGPQQQLQALLTQNQNQQQFGFNQALLGQQIQGQSNLQAAQLAAQQAMQNQALTVGERQSALQSQTALQGYAAQVQQANIAAQAGMQEATTQANAAMLPAQLQQQRFGQVFPYLQGQFGQLGQQLGQFGQASQGSAAAGNQPYISDRPIYTNQDIQQQVNAQRAANDAQTQGGIQRMQNQMAGRGFGSNSPLAQALGVSMQNANLGANTANEQQTRWGAAQGNAQQRLAAQQAREQQYGARQSEDIQRQKNVLQAQTAQQSALLSALGGLA